MALLHLRRFENCRLRIINSIIKSVEKFTICGICQMGGFGGEWGMGPDEANLGWSGIIVEGYEDGEWWAAEVLAFRENLCFWALLLCFDANGVKVHWFGSKRNLAKIRSNPNEVPGKHQRSFLVSRLLEYQSSWCLQASDWELVLVGSSNQPTHADVSRSLEELVSLVRRINSQNESLRDTFVLLTQSKKVKLDTLSARLLNLSWSRTFAHRECSLAHLLWVCVDSSNQRTSSSLSWISILTSLFSVD